MFRLASSIEEFLVSDTASFKAELQASASQRHVKVPGVR
jgi:hypothetical protein